MDAKRYRFGIQIVGWKSTSRFQNSLINVLRSRIDWSELNCRVLTPKNGGNSVSESIKRMRASCVSVKEVNIELLDHFIGPNGEEPELLLCCGALDLVSTKGYPPWVC